MYPVVQPAAQLLKVLRPACITYYGLLLRNTKCKHTNCAGSSRANFHFVRTIWKIILPSPIKISMITLSDTAVWYHNGMPAVPIRWVLFRDPKGKFETRALLSTDLSATPAQILKWFVRRWQVEVTFQEVRFIGLVFLYNFVSSSVINQSPIAHSTSILVCEFAPDVLGCYRSRS